VPKTAAIEDPQEVLQIQGKTLLSSVFNRRSDRPMVSHILSFKNETFSIFSKSQLTSGTVFAGSAKV
jgi:hypothetical protein